MEPTASVTSALSISSPPGSRRKKTKAITGPNMRERPASRFTDIVPMFEPPWLCVTRRVHWVQSLPVYTRTPELWPPFLQRVHVQRGLRSYAQRRVNCHCDALSEPIACYRNGSWMRLDYGSGDGQSQSRAAYSVTAGLVCTVEALEDMWNVFSIHAGPVVDDRDRQRPVGIQPGPNDRCCAALSSQSFHWTPPSICWPLPRPCLHHPIDARTILLGLVLVSTSGRG